MYENTTLIQQEQKRAKEFLKTFIAVDEKGRVCLTQENATKIEALIRFNPRYGKVVDKNNQDCAMSLIKQFRDDKLSYDNDCMEKIIRRLNFENSTRMDNDEMRELADRLISIAKTKDELFALLKNINNDYQLIGELAKKTFFGKRRFSFATKFCHYMCYYLFKDEYQDYYSIYDNIVINYLPDYMELANITDRLLPFTKEKDPHLNLSKYYERYQGIIDTIIKECSDRTISRHAFDHILWYSSKALKTNLIVYL